MGVIAIPGMLFLLPFSLFGTLVGWVGGLVDWWLVDIQRYLLTSLS
jgi:hypothetical protein